MTMDRSEGERVRLRHGIERVRSQLEGLEIALRCEGPIGTEIAQAIVQGALDVAIVIARHDAFDLVENVARPDHHVTCQTCRDTHVMTLHTSGGDEREVPCTRCPTPCVVCRGGTSAYCRATPCRCECHANRKASP